MNQVQKRILVAWNPYQPNQFVVSSNDLRFYNIKLKKSRQSSSNIQFSSEIPAPQEFIQKKDEKSISLLSVNHEVQYGRCLAWTTNKDISDLLAVGLPSGKVVLANGGNSSRILKEFVPKHSRACNALAWNPIETNLLAAGLDKVRSDTSTFIWDLEASSTTTPEYDLSSQTSLQTSEKAFNISPMEAVETVVKPWKERIISEATISLAWVPDSPKCLVVGTGIKWLRLLDLRGFFFIYYHYHYYHPFH